METSVSKINVRDYHVVLNHRATEIDTISKRIYCLFVRGGGYNEGLRYYGQSDYELYLVDKHGGTLTKIGDASSFHNGYKFGCEFTICGDKHKFEGLTIGNFFTSIFKNDNQ